MRLHRTLSLTLAVTLGAVAAVVAGGSPAHAATPLFQMPFPCGQAWVGETRLDHGPRWAVDLNRTNDFGDPVVASYPGDVVRVEDQGAAEYGRWVEIRHPDGWRTRYAHLSAVHVGVGDSVAMGQRVGSVGDTGNSRGSHLHYEQRLNGDDVAIRFNGSLIHYDGTRTYTSRNCGTPVLAGESVDGNRFDDLVAVDAAGVMWWYPGKAGGSFAGRVRVGSGWVSNYNRIAVGDSNGDGLADLHATATDGDLFYWRNRGDGVFSVRARVGNGWKSIEWFALADVNGDNRADILARDGGHMYLFLGRSDGGFATRSFLGSGWGAYPQHFAGDADGDGDADIWAVDTSGRLWFWRGNGRGGFASAVDVGSGWGGFERISVLDAGGDGRADIVAVRASDDTLWRWPGRGDGGFLQGAQIGSGWDGYRIATY